MKEVCTLAIEDGIESFGEPRIQLSSEFLKASDNFDCFGKATDYYDQD